MSAPGSAGDIGVLRRALVGLIRHSCGEEEQIILAADGGEQGSPEQWAAHAIVAHNTEFKRQQVERLRCVARRASPPTFPETDHRSAEDYANCAGRDRAEVRAESCRVGEDLIEAIDRVTDEDLCDPGRNPWLAGRQLWLQVVVRGFWHPMGHVGEYHLQRRGVASAVALQQWCVASAEHLRAPVAALGMARYNLGCAQAWAEMLPEAAASIRVATALNGDLGAKSLDDPDLEPLRAAGLLG